VGLAATAAMLATFLYALRKRWRGLHGRGAIRKWLDWHVFVGFMTPFLTAFHAAFRTNNLVATATTWALAIVVLTGVIGRFLYGMVPSSEDRATELDELASRFERIRERARPVLAESGSPARLEAVLDLATREVARGSLLRLVLSLPASALRLRFRVWRVRKLIPDPVRLARFRDELVRLNRLRFQIAFYDRLRNFLRVWRVLHATLAVSVFLGYGLR
jgi:hypothetical protein